MNVRLWTHIPQIKDIKANNVFQVCWGSLPLTISIRKARDYSFQIKYSTHLCIPTQRGFLTYIVARHQSLKNWIIYDTYRLFQTFNFNGLPLLSLLMYRNIWSLAINYYDGPWCNSEDLYYFSSNFIPIFSNECSALETRTKLN